MNVAVPSISLEFPSMIILRITPVPPGGLTSTSKNATFSGCMVATVALTCVTGAVITGSVSDTYSDIAFGVFCSLSLRVTTTLAQPEVILSLVLDHQNGLSLNVIICSRSHRQEVVDIALHKL